MGRLSNSLKFLMPPVVVLVCFWGPSFYGLNFGAHWDENRAKFDAVRDSLSSGLFLQAADLADSGGNYNHGGVNYLLTWAGFTPEVLKYMWSGPRTREALSRAITPILYSNAARIRVRAIFVVLSSLCIVWLFCLNLMLGRGRGEAFLAAAILASSWEVAYHSRWVAPDAVMMQFALLSFLCLALGVQSKGPRWFYCGAIVAGLTIGTKYTGGITLPFFLAGAGLTLWHERRSAVYALKHCLGLTAAAGLTFLLTTPGAAIDPFRFFEQLQEQQEIYAAGWYGYSVQPGLPHLLAILRYFSLQVFSHYWSVSIVLAVFCAVGIIALILERRLVTGLLLACGIVSVIFFSQQLAMIVRNLLIVVPLLALASARGIVMTGERLGRSGRRALYAVVAVLLAINLGWQVYAARQVKIRFHPDSYAREFVEHVRQLPKETVLISANLSRLLHDNQMSLPANVVSGRETPHTKVAFLQSESADVFWETWPSNRWGMYDRVFGPLEVNLEAYSTFIGNQRILLVSQENFRKLPIKESDLSLP